jgi:hypothetical protein
MEVITSHTIKMDMNSSLEKLLNEVGIIHNSETKIKDYQDKIAAYKAENERLIKKANDLNRFGFVNTPTPKNKEIIDAQIGEYTKMIDDLKAEIREKKSLEQTVAKYSLEYPTFKFIPTDTMIKIMKKYDLVLGETCMYSKEIPTIALDILNGFNSKIKQEKFFIDARSVAGNLTYFSLRPSESVLGVEKKSNYIKSNLKIIAPESHFTNWIIESNGEKIPTFIVNEKTREYEINMAKMAELVKKNTEVLDPILCLEVEEGYIVLHAWDEEAHIPEIRNTILN